MTNVQTQAAPRAPKYSGSYVTMKRNEAAAGSFRHAMIKAALRHKHVAKAERALAQDARFASRRIDWRWLITHEYIAFLD